MNDASRVCRCVLCHDYGDRDENDRLDEDTIADVRQYGWSVLMIPEDDLGPGWAYTIGCGTVMALRNWPCSASTSS